MRHTIKYLRDFQIDIFEKTKRDLREFYEGEELYRRFDKLQAMCFSEKFIHNVLQKLILEIVKNQKVENEQ